VKKSFMLLVSICLALIAGCESSQKAITSFQFEALNVKGVITEDTHSIAVTVPSGTDVTRLTPTITHTGEKIRPASGVAQNFTHPVVYTVESEAGSTQEYTVTVTIASDKAITSFGFEDPYVEGVITEETHAIAVAVPYGTDLTALVPIITHTGKDVSPASGVAQDFTNPVVYTVESEGGATQDYTVTVTVTSNKAITSFRFEGLGAEGVITETTHTITVTVPSGTDVTSLIPAMTYTGTTVFPAAGVAQDFTHPVVYVVWAEDNSTQKYTVTVTVSP